jgi:Xaa-Pro aminopeptidase
MPRTQIPKAEFEQRQKTIRRELLKLGLDALLAVSGYAERDGNVCYLCGHKNAFPYSPRGDAISGLGYSAFLVPAEGKTTLISPLGFQQDFAIGVDSAKTGLNFAQELINAISDSHLERSKLGIAGGDIIPAVYVDEIKRVFPDLAMLFADDLVAEQRMIKSETELELLRQASRVADKAVHAAIDSIKPGMMESAIGSVARKIAMEAGADYVVRDRVQSGAEIGRLRWPFASRKKVRKGELVSIDFVGWANRYGFDILRIGCVGLPSREQRLLLEAAGEATEAMSNALTDGVSIESAVNQLRTVERSGMMIEPFGHGIGLDIVESPYLLPGVKGIVKKNTVLCVEPTVRWRKASASVENELIITESKPEVLTHLPVDFWK